MTNILRMDVPGSRLSMVRVVAPTIADVDLENLERFPVIVLASDGAITKVVNQPLLEHTFRGKCPEVRRAIDAVRTEGAYREILEAAERRDISDISGEFARVEGELVRAAADGGDRTAALAGLVLIAIHERLRGIARS